MAISKEQVFKIADEMFADGESPTLIALRKKLGSGSYSTISNFLTEWKAAQRPSDVTPEVEVPDEIEMLFGLQLRQLWSKAIASAQDLAQLVRDEAMKLVSDKEAERLEAMTVATTLQEEVEYGAEIIRKNMEREEALKLDLQRKSEAIQALQAEKHTLTRINAELIAKIGKPRAAAAPAAAAKKTRK